MNPDNRVQLEHEVSRRAAAAAKAERRAQYRRDHPEATTKLDGVIDALASMEDGARRG